MGKEREVNLVNGESLSGWLFDLSRANVDALDRYVALPSNQTNKQWRDLAQKRFLVAKLEALVQPEVLARQEFLTGPWVVAKQKSVTQ